MDLSVEDRDKLLKALEHILEVLQLIVKEDLAFAISSSYRELGLIPIFEESFLHTRDEIVIARREILNATTDLVKRLKDHDLVDKSLEWKTQIIKKEYHNYKNERKNTSLLKKLIGKCLGGFDVLLESLADCIPGLGAAVEFKKGVEYVTKEE